MLSRFFAEHFNTVGLIGVVIILIAYLLLQIDKLSQDSVSFSLSNVIGSGLILISLFYAWNLSAVAMEIAWFVISSFGLIKAFVLRSRRGKLNG